MSRNGSTTNTGLTADSPWTLGKAIVAINTGPGGDTVRLLPGDYLAAVLPILKKSASWVATGPGVRLTGFTSTGVIWTLERGTAGAPGATYSTPKGNTDAVFDTANLTEWGDYQKYATKGTATDASAAMALLTEDGQIAFDGANLYVRPIGGLNLTNASVRGGVRLRYHDRQAIVGLVSAGADVVQYFRGIAFEGLQSLGAQVGSTWIIEDCDFRYGKLNAVNHDAGHSIAIRCAASSNDRDGFNYHDVAMTGAEFIEIDCESHHNGMENSPADSNNATSAHEDVVGIRVGGNYHHTTGPTVADVNNAKTWNLGCYAADSIAVTTYSRQNYRTEGDSAEMWLDECSSDGRNLPGPLGGTGFGYTFWASSPNARIHISGFFGAAKPDPVEPSNAATAGFVDYYDAN